MFIKCKRPLGLSSYPVWVLGARGKRAEQRGKGCGSWGWMGPGQTSSSWAGGLPAWQPCSGTYFLCSMIITTYTCYLRFTNMWTHLILLRLLWRRYQYLPFKNEEKLTEMKLTFFPGCSVGNSRIRLWTQIPRLHMWLIGTLASLYWWIQTYWVENLIIILCKPAP